MLIHAYRRVATIASPRKRPPSPRARPDFRVQPHRPRLNALEAQVGWPHPQNSTGLAERLFLC